MSKNCGGLEGAAHLGLPRVQGRGKMPTRGLTAKLKHKNNSGVQRSLVRMCFLASSSTIQTFSLVIHWLACLSTCPGSSFVKSGTERNGTLVRPPGPQACWLCCRKQNYYTQMAQ